MRECIGVIKYTFCCSVIVAIIAYIVSVNMEIHFINLRAQWISNEFVLAISSGIFTGFFVMMLCEIYKYIQVKRTTEDFMFFQGMYLYQALLMEKQDIEEYLANPGVAISGNFLGESARKIQCEVDALDRTDYATFRKDKNELMYKHAQFCTESLCVIRQTLSGPNKLEIAILKTKQDVLKERMVKHDYSMKETISVSSNDEEVNKVLCEQSKILVDCIKLTDEYLKNICMCCKGRYKWQERKQKITIPSLLTIMNEQGNS